MDIVTKGFVVSLLVFACILFGGGLVLFRGSEVGTQASTAAAFVVGYSVLCWFDRRENRFNRYRR
jgi:hypothetical protein